MSNTLDDNLNRLTLARSGIASAITAKGGIVGESDGFEDFVNIIPTLTTYSSADNTKVVKNGVLTAQTAASNSTITSNGTYNYTTTYNKSKKVIVNVPGLESLYIADTYYSTEGCSCTLGYALVTKSYIIVALYGNRYSRNYGSYFRIGDANLENYISNATLVSLSGYENSVSLSSNCGFRCFYYSGSNCYVCYYSTSYSFTGNTLCIAYFNRN